MRYVVIVEKGATSYGAYVPDLPGCVAVAETKEEGLPVPPPASSSEYVEVTAA